MDSANWNQFNPERNPIMKRAICWLRTNLRLGDHPALQMAIEENDEVLLVYVFDKRFWNIERMGSARAKFLLESLHELRSEVNQIGGEIEFLYGNAVKEISKLMAELGCDTCYAQREDAPYEASDEKALAKKCRLELCGGKGLLENEDLPFPLKDLPQTFSVFRRKVEKQLKIREICPKPKTLSCSWKPRGDLATLGELGYNIPSFDERSVLDFRGGEREGWARMNGWIWERNCLQKYKDTRNGLLGADHSSKLSPWLSAGCLSAVQVYWEIKKYEEYRTANESTYWLFFELLWREFFRFVARKHGAKLFMQAGIKGEKVQSTIPHHEALQEWCQGKTGNSLVDANITELIKSGWMSNRGRQIVASYLVNDLGQNWLAGARFFEHHLIDYDACSNYGNWAYLGGVGNDPRPKRAFNVSKQAEIYDTKNAFRDHWLQGK